MDVIRKPDSNTKLTYSFCLFGLTAVFDGYTKFVRLDGKRSWTRVEKWCRVGYTRENNVPQPVLDESIKEELLNKLKSSLVVSTWEEYKKY